MKKNPPKTTQVRTLTKRPLLYEPWNNSPLEKNSMLELEIYLGPLKQEGKDVTSEPSGQTNLWLSYFSVSMNFLNRNLAISVFRNRKIRLLASKERRSFQFGYVFLVEKCEVVYVVKLGKNNIQKYGYYINKRNKYGRNLICIGWRVKEPVE